MERESSASNRDLSARDHLLIAAAVILGVGVYLLASAWTYRLGFPLDDSWIHATYARNLATRGEWAFQVGHPSAGSTSPLWTILLVPGFWTHLAPLWWSYLLGAVVLYGLAVLAEITARRTVAGYSPVLPWTGLFFAAEWHMLWAAASGMETLLQAFLSTAVLALLISGSRRYLAMGLLTGISLWVRPDGLTLGAPVLLTILIVERTVHDRSRALASYLMGFGSLLLPYLLLNLRLSGTPMPNTFYAKQAEYAVWQSRPLPYRAGIVLVQLLTGPAILLVPGMVVYGIHIIERRNVRMVAAAIWCAGFSLLYMLRLPAYQHARYLMPAMPMLFLFGLFGYLEFRETKALSRPHLMTQKAWPLALALLTVGFLFLGARAYAQDVGLIESEMVNTATWVAQRIPEQAIVAAHDVGALGYFDDHQLLDLAGLVSPEVVPFMRDQAKLAAYLDRRGARYLIAFPSLYPELAAMSTPIHTSGGPFAVVMGQQNMTVYCWRCR